MLVWESIVLVFLIVCSAFFSGAEVALLSLNKVKVKTLLKQKRRGAEALHRLKKDPHKIIVTILIGNNVVNTAAAVLATVVFTQLFGSSGAGIAAGAMTLVFLVFGEITPKTLASQQAERISLIVARPVEILAIVLLPLVKFFDMIPSIIRKLTGAKHDGDVSEEELRTFVKMGRDAGIISREAAEMMHNVMEFEGTKVTKIMTPKVSMEMLDGDMHLSDILDFVVKKSYSRYPVYLEEKDRVVGILDVDDVVKYARNNRLDAKVKTLVRDVLFVPETKDIDELLTDFEEKDLPVAVVVNEYGQVLGMVTEDDILNEIVGDIFAKRRQRRLVSKYKGEQILTVDAMLPIEDAAKLLGLTLDEDEVGMFNTLAGYIQHKLKRLPKKGEKLVLPNATIEVTDVTPRGILSVQVVRVNK